MIPGALLDFLEGRGSFAVAGTRDANLVPHVHYVSGWLVEPDRQTIRCLINRAYLDGLFGSLEDNGQFCLTVEQIGTHETYQFKGMYVGSADLTDADLAAHHRASQKFAKALSLFVGYPEPVGRSFIRRPDVIVRFAVREVFVQTPGPVAGRRIFPSEEQ